MTEQSRPRLSPHVRLRPDRPRGGSVLLAPERGLVLNHTAEEILQLCDGHRTVDGIAEILADRHGAHVRAAIQKESLAFLSKLYARGLIRV